MRKNIAVFAPLFLLISICIITAIFSPVFTTQQNLINIFRQTSVMGLLSVGLAMVIIVGHMDLSIGSIVSLSGVCAILMSEFVPAGIAILVALSVGAVAGLLNGFLVVRFHANNGESLMITFGTQLLFSAIALLLTGGFTLSGSSSAFYNAIGTYNIAGFFPLSALIVIVITIVLYIMESQTKLGRKIHMVGYNAECCRLSGINVGKIKIICYMICGMLGGAAGVMLTSRTVSATPSGGNGLEMEAIIAVVLGGVSLAGGTGSAIQAYIGVITLGVISNSMNLLDFGVHDQVIAKGIVLIFAIAIDAFSQTQKEKGGRK